MCTNVALQVGDGNVGGCGCGHIVIKLVPKNTKKIQSELS